MTHERFRLLGRKVVIPLSIITPIVLSPLPLRVHGEIFIGLGIFVGYEIGKYITPDADIMGTTSAEGWLVNDVPVLGHFVFGILSAYGSIFRRSHRKPITHMPFMSTAIRYLFLFWWPILEIYRSTLDWAWLIFLFIGMFVGTSISDGIHWFLDTIRYPKSE